VVSEKSVNAALHYRELIVWQKAMDLVELIYQLTKLFPREELYGLTSQIRRAAVSIPSNIAVGQARKSTAEFRNFLSIAQGSRAELETQMLIAIRLKFLAPEQAEPCMALLAEISRMLNALHSKLTTRH
jgi:four helix bundle protein